MSDISLNTDSTMRVRNRILIGITAFCVISLLGYLSARALLREIPGVNSYGALADAFLHGRLWIDHCTEMDCALVNGKTYIIFPPFPAVLVMPFIGLLGFTVFKGFMLLALLISAASLGLWWSIFRVLHVERTIALWLLAALACASPLYHVTAGGGGVWGFAQTVAFFFTSASIWAVLCRKSLLLAGLCIALAFLCRQMSIFYPLFLVVLALADDEPLLRPSRERLVRMALASIPIIAALLVYFIYNYVRFANPFDTGYGYITASGQEGWLSERITAHGLFSPAYFLFNAVYLFIQGTHFDFTGPDLLHLKGVDMAGAGLLATSPWVLLAYYSKVDRVFAAGAAVITLLVGIMLFYHGNGLAQVNTQRFTLDWLPILVVLMVRGKRPPQFSMLPMLVTWGVAANAITLGLISFYHL